MVGQIMMGLHARGMLTTGFDGCQGNRVTAGLEVPQLSAGTEYVPPAALSNEDVDAGLAQRGLKTKDVMVRRSTEARSRKFIKGDQVHFAAYPVE